MQLDRRWKQGEVVLEHIFGNGQRCDVNEARAWVSQKDERKQQPLFVVVYAINLLQLSIVKRLRHGARCECVRACVRVCVRVCVCVCLPASLPPCLCV